MYFDFNFYSSLLLPFFVHGLVFTGLLLYRGYKEDVLSDKLLAALVLFSTLKVAFWMLGFAGWYDTHDAYSSFMFYFPFDFLLWIGPAMYFYFQSLTTPNFSFKKSQWRHFVLPSLWLLLIFAKFLVDFAFYAPFPIEVANQYGTKGPWADLDKHQVAVAAGYLSFGYYTWLTLKAYKSYQSFIQQNYSFSDEVDPKWLRNLLLWIATGVGLFLLLNLFATFVRSTSYKIDWYAYFGLGVINYYLSIAGYFGSNLFQQKVAFEPEAFLDAPVQRPEEVVLSENETTTQNALFELMLTERPYLRSDLTLNELAKLLGSNTAIISKVINQSGNNFNDFINDYRVREVQRKMERMEHQSKTLLALAFDSGFNSKATFNRAFKKIVGKTPKGYSEALGK